jgi:hypothetical protein
MDKSSSLWYTLCVYLNLRTLSTTTLVSMVLPCPPVEIWRYCAFFPTLKRLVLNNISHDHLGLFVDWFRSTTRTTVIPLTHFRLHSSRGLPDAGVINLLELLEHSPVKALILEGLAKPNFLYFTRLVMSLAKPSSRK